ncbi:MAG: carbohydrate ABC transporter permease [Chloroflexota bacterium]
MTAASMTSSDTHVKKSFDWRRALLHVSMIIIAMIWLFPLAWTVYQSLRPFSETSAAPVAFPQTLTLDNYINAWNQGDLLRYFLNTLVIVVPAVIIVLLLASMMAFAVSRYSWRFNLILLMIFTALNLLPPQVIITPLYRMYLAIGAPVTPLTEKGFLLYDQYLGMIVIHVAFQLGFCTFVLSNYMKTLPKELNEAAVVDGASVWTTFHRIILPLTRPALAALATLQVTWIYNDFFWALMLMRTGSKYPITSALNNLRGQFFTDNNLLAAGAVIVALPTLIVYLVLQKQFIGGLTLGSTKG